MFDIAPTELLIIAVVALVVIGPKDLPRVMRMVGQWVGRAKGMARHFRSGIDTMIREAELEEMEKKWKAENERIMREHPQLPPVTEESAAAAPPPDDAEAPPAASATPAGPEAAQPQPQLPLPEASQPPRADEGER